MTEANTKKFHIKIGILGCESTGKTTVLNALLGGEYSEANYGRTTEGINVFHLSEVDSGPEVMCIDPEDTKRSHSPNADEARSSKRLCDPERTFNAIKQNNAMLREIKKRGQESHFDITLTELPITMLSDTQLVIIESPGLNVSKGINEEPRSYIEKNWPRLDAVVLVVDARQSVDYDDQMENLSFVHNLWSTKKEIPIFILCNKVDDPDNLSAEEKHKLEAVRSKVQDQWKVLCREKALEQLLSPECSKYEDIYPAFLPVSAKTAYLVRAGSAMVKKDFCKKMPVEYFHSIGQQEFGKKWRNMSDEDKQESIHHHLLSPENRTELLRMSGFDKFLKSLEICAGGEQAQLAMIRKNFKRDLEQCDLGACDLLSKLRSMNRKRLTLDEPEDLMKAKFWNSYPQWADPAVKSFEECYKPDGLAIPAQKLLEYQRFCLAQGQEWTGEIEKIQRELAALVTSMVATINNKSNDWSASSWTEATFSSDPQTSIEAGSWESLSSVEWANIINSILLLRCEKAFCRKFGRAIILLDRILAIFSDDTNLFCSGPGCTEDDCEHLSISTCARTRLEQKSWRETPCHKEAYSKVVRFEIPESYESSPSHFAHVGWLYCEAVTESQKQMESSD